MKGYFVFKAVTASVALALCSCGGGSSSESTANAVCQGFGGGASSTVSSVSAGSTIANAPAAFDRDLDTFATLTTTGTGNGTLRGTAQSGVVGAAGSVAGAAVSTPANGTYTITIATYLNDVLQESRLVDTETYSGGSATSQNCADVCLNRTDGLSYYGLTTSQAFDAIEAVVDVNGATSPLEIRELCLR